MHLWHIDCFKLVIFLRNSRQGGTLKTKSGSYPLLRDIYLYEGNFHLLRCQLPWWLRLKNMPTVQVSWVPWRRIVTHSSILA